MPVDHVEEEAAEGEEEEKEQLRTAKVNHILLLVS